MDSCVGLNSGMIGGSVGLYLDDPPLGDILYDRKGTCQGQGFVAVTDCDRFAKQGGAAGEGRHVFRQLEVGQLLGLGVGTGGGDYFVGQIPSGPGGYGKPHAAKQTPWFLIFYYIT